MVPFSSLTLVSVLAISGLLRPAADAFVVHQRSPAVSTRLRLFGSLIGTDEGKKVDGELASFAQLAKSKDDVDVAFDSMSTYLEDWAKLFEGEKGKQRGLTTPVTVSSYEYASASDDEEGVVATAGVKLVFRPPKDSYFSKAEERAREDGSGEEKKKEETSPGGVEVMAQKASGGDELRVVARRCDIEEDTVIKEMSEEAIVDDLRKAIKIWRDERRG